MNLFELAGGAVMEQVQAAAKRVFENIYDRTQRRRSLENW